jgi:dihydroorotase
MVQSRDTHFDLIIRVGRIVCPDCGIDGPGRVALRGERIAAVEQSSSVKVDPATADRYFDFPDGVLLPGLIDVHAHPANSGSVFGVSPDEHIVPYGTTTVLSQGDAGASTIDQYIGDTISASRTKVLLAINLSRIGESEPRGCFEDLGDIDIDACVAAIDRYKEFIPAVAVNVSDRACGDTDPREVTRRGIEVAEQTNRPMLFGMRRPEDWPLDQQLDLLRPGDIVTYCFRSRPHCIVQDGQVLPCVRDARSRGILFDVGHGTSAFCFDVAQAAIDDGFLPDTISTDLQRLHIDQALRHDLPRVMSELRAAGMPENEVFAAVTSRPASFLKLDDSGVLRANAVADLTVLEASHSGQLGDNCAGTLWTSALAVRRGRVITT